LILKRTKGGKLGEVISPRNEWNSHFSVSYDIKRTAIEKWKEIDGVIDEDNIVTWYV
jgi:hypothetical protein